MPDHNDAIDAIDAIVLRPIGHVRGGRADAVDDRWGAVMSAIELDPAQFTPEALAGLEAFSHLEVVYFFHGVPVTKVETGARHPRNRADWPRVGIFAQRGKNRPNRIGVSRCNLVRVEGLKIVVQKLDAIDGTPVLDVKPYLSEFGPLGSVSQPTWATELMARYYDDE